MSPSKQSASMPDTPEASLKRDKFKFNAVIEKYIALAHGLPPPPDTSSMLQTECPQTTSQKRQHASTGKITKKSKVVTHSLRQSRGNVPHILSSSIEEEIAHEVEESLLRRKEELGLPDDYVFKEVMKDDPKCHVAHHSVKKNATHNSLTAPKRSKQSSKSPRKRGRKMLEDVINSKKLVSHSQPKALKRKVREEIKELDIDVILSSPELKMKKVRKMSEGSKNKKWDLNESISPNRRAKESKKDLNIDARQMSTDKSKTPRKDTRGKKSPNRRKKKNYPTMMKTVGKTTAQNIERESNAAVACDLELAEKGEAQEEEKCSKLLDAMKKAVWDKVRSGACILHMVQEQNDIFCLFDDLETVHINISQGNERASQTVKSYAGKEKTSMSSEHQSGKMPANKRTKGEPEQTVRRDAGTKRTSTSSEQQSGRVAANKKRREAEKGQTVRRDTSTGKTISQQTVRRDTGTASEQQSVIEYANKKGIEPKPELAVRTHAVKGKMSTTSELQSTNKHTLRQKTNTALEEQKVRLPVNKDKKIPAEPEETKSNTIKEKTGTPAAQLTVKVKNVRVPMNKIKKTKAKQDEQTKRIQGNLQEKTNTAQQSSRIPNNKAKETEKQHTVTAQGISHKVKTKVNQNTKIHPKKLEETRHGKCQSKAACTNEKIDTQQKQQHQERKQETVKKIRQVYLPASEVYKNAPNKREVRAIVAKRSDSQKVQVSVPINTESHDIPKAPSKRRVTQLSMTGLGEEVTDVAENSALPSSPRNVSHSSTDSSYQLTGNGLLKKRKFGCLSFLESDEEDGEWSTISSEDNTFEERNVKKKKKKKKRGPYHLPELSKKNRSKRLSKSSNKADDDDDDDDIIILTSLSPPTQNENNPNVANTVNENHTQTSTSYTSHKKPAPIRNWMMKRTLEGKQRNSFSERSASSLIAKQQQRKTETTAAAEQSTEEGLGLGDTWSLLCYPPVQQNFSHHISRAGMSLQGSQHMETSSIHHQVTASTSRNSRILTNTNTFANNTTPANTTATMASKPSESFWVMRTSEEEADNGTLTTTMMSGSTMQNPDITSASQVTFSRRTGLPDYRTLGPERWRAAVRKLQKSKKI
ncbi:uncharacterized protein LOC135110234 isoform X2 [Scylla paramamosain]|uniref:uncharacterized protein LOC135110234 isoform X1 n=1 Tax=Scylla paramamosain TaxID=85552 RepID=UPI003083712E